MKVAKKKWQEKEIAVLERMAERFPPEQIVKRLRHIGFYRSEKSVINKLARLQMSRRTTLDNMSSGQVGQLLGIHHTTVSNWIKNGLLVGVRAKGSYMILQKDIKRMLLNPPPRISRHVSRFNPDGVKYLLDDY